MKRNKESSIALAVLFLISTIGVVDGAVNLISNPGFESGTTSWNFYTSGTGTFTTPSPGFEETKSAKLALTSSSGNIQLFQTGVVLEANTRYRLNFAAYSNTGHDMTVRLFKHGTPYTPYMPEFTVNLGTSWQTFSNEFTSSPGSMNDGRLMFWLAQYAAAGDSYYIDAIVLEKVVAGGDSSPPIVTGSTPTGTGIPVNSQITVIFNESMNQGTAQTAFSTSPATSGSLSWSGNIMTYTPSSLSTSTTYTVIIGTSAKDLAGNSLKSPYSWSFTTSGGSSSIEARLAALEAENAALKTLLAGVSRNGSDIYIDGANLHIRDGSGDTAGPVNGLGNLIIGYNEERGFIDNRTGSHNLIIGIWNNYGSYGGLVAGAWNQILGPYASISGGNKNTASGQSSSISGGKNNVASNLSSSVSGGYNNKANGTYTSVSGGSENTASDAMQASDLGNPVLTRYSSAASVSGGYGNIASGLYSSVSGGEGNIANGGYTSVSGGSTNHATDWFSPMRSRANSYATVSGGKENIASGIYSTVSGGQGNNADGWSSSVSGGHSRMALDDYNWAAGGLFQDQ